MPLLTLPFQISHADLLMLRTIHEIEVVFDTFTRGKKVVVGRSVLVGDS